MGTVTVRDRLCTNTVHFLASTMKFMISLVTLALVAGINAAPGFFENEANGLTSIGEIQASITNIGYGADDLNTMEGKLEPLTTDVSVKAAETAITEAMDASDLANSWVHENSS